MPSIATVLVMLAGGAVAGWAGRYLVRVVRGQEAPPTVDRTKSGTNDFHGHY